MSKAMNGQKSRMWLLLFLLPILVAVAVLAAAWAAATFWSPRVFMQPPEFPHIPDWGTNRIYIVQGDLEFYYMAKTVFSTLNITVLIFLIAVYIDLYRKTRSEFTVGLIIFSAALLLYALASNPILIRAFGFRPIGLGPFALLPDLFAFAALIVLLYLSLKY